MSYYGYLLIQIFLIISINILILIFCIISSDQIANILGFSFYILLFIPLLIILNKIRFLLDRGDMLGKDFINSLLRFSLFIELFIGIILFIELVMLFFFS
jgi:hypothetical protein